MAIIAGCVTLAAASQVTAGAWVQPKGKGQVIVKYEDIRADEAFDDDGEAVALTAERFDRALGVFAEYGLTDTLTLQLKADWQEGEDSVFQYSGRGPVEVGVTWQAWRSDDTAVSLYGGYADGGEGRNAGYAAPGQGERDWEVRASAGRSFGGLAGAMGPSRTFVEVQGARRFREGLADEYRVDFTMGGHFGEDWLVLGQAYGGVADDDDSLDRRGARWLSLEASVVRDLGDWSFQAGWRHAVAGRQTPVGHGPVLAIWRRF